MDIVADRTSTRPAHGSPQNKRGAQEAERRTVQDRVTRPHNSPCSQNSGPEGDFGDTVNCEDASAAWDYPTPLAEFDRPDFPTHLLPNPMRAYVEALALATQTPSALAALLCLAVLAAAAAKRVVVRVRQGWEEGVNIFVVVVLPSGNRRVPSSPTPSSPWNSTRLRKLSDSALRSPELRTVARSRSRP